MMVTVDKYTRVMLTVIAGLLLVVGLGLWHETPSTIAPAYGQIPDSGQQLQELIVKVDDINKSLGKLNLMLTSGKIKVQVVAPKEDKAAAKTAPKVTPKPVIVK
jgi:hypothetical protein